MLSTAFSFFLMFPGASGSPFMPSIQSPVPPLTASLSFAASTPLQQDHTASRTTIRYVLLELEPGKLSNNDRGITVLGYIAVAFFLAVTPFVTLL
jgi:hypothetical protein